MQYPHLISRIFTAFAGACLLTAPASVQSAEHPLPARDVRPVPPQRDPSTANKICFVCDASATMKPKLPVVIEQLGKAVASLRPIQSFTIVIFQDRGCLAFNAGKLVAATPENKRDGAKFLTTVHTSEKTDPMPGLELAFGEKPDSMYLLADRDFPDNDAVLKKIRELNKEGKVSIRAIAFEGDGDKNTAYLDLLETIAKESGGKFMHVKMKDLEDPSAAPATRPTKGG